MTRVVRLGATLAVCLVLLLCTATALAGGRFCWLRRGSSCPPCNPCPGARPHTYDQVSYAPTRSKLYFWVTGAWQKHANPNSSDGNYDNCLLAVYDGESFEPAKHRVYVPCNTTPTGNVYTINKATDGDPSPAATPYNDGLPCTLYFCESTSTAWEAQPGVYPNTLAAVVSGELGHTYLPCRNSCPAYGGGSFTLVPAGDTDGPGVPTCQYFLPVTPP
jgi:hypothetical protein